MIIMLMISALLTSCNLDPGHTVYTNVVIPIDERQVPETGVANQPVNIYVSTAEDNGCWSNIRFSITARDEREFEVWAVADFESDGQCPDVIVSADSTLTFTPTRTGNHVITFWMTPTISVRDTVVVGSGPGKK